MRVNAPFLTILLTTFFYFCIGVTAQGEYDNVRVKGSFKSSSPVEISIYNIFTKKSNTIDYYKNKFEFFVPKNNFVILTVRDNNKKGKSVLISTYTKAEFDKKQQFIVAIDLNKDISAIEDGDKYAEKCSGSIRYSTKYNRFYYQKKSTSFDQIISDLKQKMTKD